MIKGALKPIMEIAQEIMQDFPTKLGYDGGVDEYYLDIYYLNSNLIQKYESRFDLLWVGTKDGVSTFYHNPKL